MSASTIKSSDASKQKQATIVDLGHLGKVSLNQVGKTTTTVSHAAGSSGVTTPSIGGSRPPIQQHITVKKGGAITGPFPGPGAPVMRPAMIGAQQIRGSITPPMTTSPSVFTGSQTMMSAQQFRGKQGWF